MGERLEMQKQWHSHNYHHHSHHHHLRDQLEFFIPKCVKKWNKREDSVEMGAQIVAITSGILIIIIWVWSSSGILIITIWGGSSILIIWVGSIGGRKREENVGVTAASMLSAASMRNICISWNSSCSVLGSSWAKIYTVWQSMVSVGHSSCLHWLEKKDGSMESHSIPVIYVPWKPSNKNCPDLLFMCRLILWLPQVLIALMLRLWFLGVLPHHQHFRREYISHEAHY